MSFEAIKWAFDQTVKPATSKFLLVCLANYANEIFQSYPSTQRLCELTSLDRKTVIDGLDHLLEIKIITDTGLRVGATKQVKVYRLNHPNTGTVPKTEEFRNSVKDSQFSLKDSQKRDTEPISNLSENQREGGSAVPATTRRRPRNIQEALERGNMIGVLEQDIRDWYRDSDACDWKRGDGTPFDNWVKQLCVHRDKLAERRARTSNNSGSAQKRELSILDLKSVIKVKEERASSIKEKFSSEGPLATDWRDANKRREFFTLHKEIKELKARIERMAQ